MENRREIRTYCREVRASPDEGELRFEGYAALFNSWSEDLGGFREIIMPGAFRGALERGDDVRALINHDPNLVLGRSTAGTAELAEDDHGLRFVIRAADTSYARDLRANMKAGNVTQCSFQFEVEPGGESWRRGLNGGPDERTLTAVRLYDISIVTFPAYQATQASARALSELKKTKLPTWRRKLAERRLKLRRGER